MAPGMDGSRKSKAAMKISPPPNPPPTLLSLVPKFSELVSLQAVFLCELGPQPMSRVEQGTS